MIPDPALWRPMTIGSSGARLHRSRHRAMACDWELFIACDDADYAEHAARAAFEEVDRIEQELSRFLPHSDIAGINRLSAGESLHVGIETIECLELARRLRAETSGAFDITATMPREHNDGRTSAGWDAENGQKHAASIAPSVPGLDIERARRLIRSRSDRLAVDLGGIGKGYALDGAVATLQSWNIGSALIHAGQSTAYGLGHPPDAPSWRLAIRDPRDHSVSLGVVPLLGRALSGSGTSVHGGHIIDPRTGGSAKRALGAWAFAASAAVSDALSTAFMILSAEEVEAYCRGHDHVSALLYAEDAPGEPSLCSFGNVTFIRK